MQVQRHPQEIVIVCEDANYPGMADFTLDGAKAFEKSPTTAHDAVLSAQMARQCAALGVK